MKKIKEWFNKLNEDEYVLFTILIAMCLGAIAIYLCMHHDLEQMVYSLSE